MDLRGDWEEDLEEDLVEYLKCDLEMDSTENLASNILGD